MPRTYDNQPNQAYLPLLRLNQSYDGRRGIDVIKDILATDTVTSNNRTYVDLLYKPNFSTSGFTNINIGFEAAKTAIARAANPKDQQFFIFLSDGEPYGSNQMGLDSLYFTQGVNVPTTFTVYFTSSNTAPSSLQTMTQNIRTNGYSATNPQSALWTIKTDYDALMRLFMENIINTILVPGNPTRMIVNGSRSSTTYISSKFVFGSAFPITGALSGFALDISYRYTDQNDRVVRDSTIHTVFYIKRQAGATVPSNISVQCEQVVTPVGENIPVTAVLRDTSGDGHLDKIELTWTDTAAIRQNMPTVAEFIKQLQITTHDGARVSLTAAETGIVADLANNRIVIILKQNTAPALETGWQSADIQLTNVPMSVSGRSFSVTKVVDAAGPVVKEVRYGSNPATGKDSLLVVFSEPVLWPSGSAAPAEVFAYFRHDTLRNDAFAAIPSSDMARREREALVMMTNSFKPVGSIDSLRLIGSNRLITDAAGNLPPANGRKAPVIYGGDKPEVGVINNPFVPGQTPVPPAIQTIYRNVIMRQSGDLTTPGSIVRIQTKRPLAPAADGSYGTAYLYDAVANLVRADLRVYQASGPTDYGVFWDGRNRNNRFVGTGTYLLVIETKDIDGKKKSSRAKIGIRR
jgi:hypothetical protein